MRIKRRHMKINGLPVKDGKALITLVVTANDVKRASIKDPTKCAAVRACKRALGASEARVHVGRTYLRYNGHWERYLTSKPLRTEIVAFDRGGKFSPGEYSLLKMQPSRKGDVSRDSRKNRNPKAKRRKYHVLTNIRPMGLTA